MYRYVHRSEPLFLDASPVVFGQVRQGNEASVQHGMAIIVIHDVQTATHALWDLLDEAEGTGVLTHMNAVVGWLGKRDAPWLVKVALNLTLEQLAVALDFEDNLLDRRVELKVENVAQRMAVDLDDAISRLDADFGTERAGGDMLHLSRSFGSQSRASRAFGMGYIDDACDTHVS